MPGLVTKAVLHLVLIKVKSSNQIKSNPGNAAWEEEDTQTPIDPRATYISVLQHKTRAGHTFLLSTLPCRAAWLEDVTQGPTDTWPACSRSHDNERVCGGQMGENVKWSSSSMELEGAEGEPVEQVASPATCGCGEFPAQAATEVHV